MGHATHSMSLAAYIPSTGQLKGSAAEPLQRLEPVEIALT